MNKPLPSGLSFEFFPPKTEEQKAALLDTQEKLRVLEPDFFSVTFGAGGSTITATAETVLALSKHKTPKVIPHLSCMGGTPDEIQALLQQYIDNGITDILALRGDVPSGMGSVGYFRYANELIEFIHEKHPNTFNITVGCYPEVHPETESFASEIKYFKQKVDAGVDRAITQFFFNPDAYHNFVDHAEKSRCGHSDHARHHANHQLCQHQSILWFLWNGHATLAEIQVAKLRRRPPFDTTVWYRIHDQTVPAVVGPRRARHTLLHFE